MARAYRLLAAVVAASIWTAAAASAAEHPTTRLLTAPLVDPANGWSELGNGTIHTPGAAAWTQAPPEIRALARGLGAERADAGKPDFISADAFIANAYDYVRNNIRTEFRFGLGKGGRGALIDQSGTPFDQAELLVKLLRTRSDVVSAYRFGTITLDAQQFGRWSGFVRELSADGSSFHVDATAACQFLADGGIPASCVADPQGRLQTVTLAHAWVSANGKALDPGFKRHKLKRGMDLAAAMACGPANAPTCGSLLVQETTQGLPPTNGPAGLEAIAGVRHAVVAGALSTRAKALEGAVKAADPNADLEDVVGGVDVDIDYSPALTATLPYSSSEQLPPMPEIPDQLRTRFTVSCGAVSQALFADELAGRRLYWAGNGLFADGLELTASPCMYEITYAPDGAISMSTTATAAVDHPYPANARAYADETVRLAFAGWGLYTFVLSVGAAGPSTEGHMADLQVVDPKPVGLGYGGSTLAAQILSQQSSADTLISETGEVSLTPHHTMGAISDSGIGTAFPASWITMHSALSAASRTGDGAARAAAFETSALIKAMLEGSVPQQQQDAVYAQSGVAELAGSNEYGVTFVRVTSSAAMQNLRASGQLTGYGQARLDRLQAFVDAGSELILPLSGTSPCSGAHCPGGYGVLALTVDGRAYLMGEYLKGGGNVAPKEPDQAVKDAAKRGEYSLKQAGYQTVDAASGALQMRPAPDVITGVGDFPFSLSIQREYTSSKPAVEEANSYVPICPLHCDVAPKHTYRGPDRDVIPRIGGGWTFNLGVGATLGADANRALGTDGGLNASAAIAGAFTLQQALKNTSLGARITAVAAAQWIAGQLVYNNAVVTIGSGTVAFHRLPTGVFNPPRGVSARLQQTNERVPYRSSSNIYSHHYNNVTLTYVDRDGAVLNFDPANGSGELGGPPTTAPWFKPTTWTFPSGVRVQFHYNAVQVGPYNTTNPNPTEVQYVLTRISNSLGRYIDFESQLLGGVPGKAFWGAIVTAVTTDGGQTARYALADCPIFPSSIGLGVTARLACNTLRVTLPGPGTPQVKYGYAAAPDSPDPTDPLRPAYRLRRWYVPSNQDVPFGVARYDELFRVRELLDVAARTDRYFLASVGGLEAVKRSEHIDPSRAAVVQLFDHRSAVILRTDPLGRSMRFAYDDAGRLIRTQSPEGNATETAYDQRGNVLRTCLIPKERAGQPCAAPPGGEDIVTTTAYVGGPALSSADCAWMAAICNKPVSEMDPRGFTTNYQWDAASGLLLQILRPADVSNVRPQVDFSYSTFTGVDGATFRLLREKIEKRTATDSLVTRYAYDPAAKFTLKTATVDPDGLAITTCFGFDPAGNLARTTDPRAESCP